MTRWILALGIVLGVTAYAPAALADDTGFTLCNRSGLDVVYAKALSKGKSGDVSDIESDGWHRLSPGQCEVLWPGSLRYRFYLIYAKAEDSDRTWAGDIGVCVAKDDFHIEGPRCDDDDTNARQFIQVDTGDSDSFTYDLK